MEDLSFQRLREELLQEIRARIGTADSQEAKRVVPRDIFDSKEEQVEKLYIAADEEHRRQGSHGRNGCKNHDGIVPACRACGPSGEGCGIPRRFRRAVVADSSENSCAKILSVLLAVEDVSPSSRTWENFLRNLNIGADTGGRPYFGDRMLPFKQPADMKPYFGDECLDLLWHTQHEFCPVFLESRFKEKRNHLSTVIRSSGASIECQTPDPDDRKGAADWFYSDIELENLIKYQRASIEDLYVEYYKYKYAAICSDEPRARVRYEFEQKAKAEGTTFYEHITGPDPKIKIFTILILMSVGPDSIAWNRFTGACLRSRTAIEQSRREICDDLLPLEFDTVKALVSSEPHEYQAFQGFQYGFRAVHLKEGKQVERPKGSHLPLLKRQRIGRGTYGSVFCVKIKGEYFREREEELAMKLMKPEQQQTEAEWASATWLFQQPMSHKNIMTALASLKLPDSLYIFFPLADCNLREYMMERNPSPPGNMESLKDRFHPIIGIAEALKYLQSDMKDDDYRKMICIHEDLKAENILVVYRGHGQILLQITDFGISTIKFEEPKSSATESKTVRRNREFKSQPRSLRNALTDPNGGDNFPHSAPEALDNGEIDARVDIWGFGTVFAEFLAWLWDGRNGLESYENARDAAGDLRSFKKAESGYAILKPEIAGWFLNELIPNIDFDEQKMLFKSSWSLVQHGLLVPDRDYRAEIGFVCKILVDIYNSEGSDVYSKINNSRLRIGSTSQPTEPPRRMTTINADVSGSRMRTPEREDGSRRSWWTSIGSKLSRRRTHLRRHSEHQMWSVGGSPSEQLVNAIQSGNMSRFQAALAQLNPLAITQAEQNLNGGTTMIALVMNKKPLTSNSDYMIADLIKRGADTKLSDTAGTILHRASEFGLTETMRTLVTYNRWIEQLEAVERRRSPLRLAVDGRHEDVVAVLLQSGANVHFPDRHNCTVLHYAVEYSNRTAVEILSSQHRELLNTPNVEGQTPLHRCAQICTKSALISAKTLLNEPVHGGEADKRFAVNIKDYSHRRPLFVVTDEVRTGNRWEMVNLLLRHGAHTNPEDLGCHAREYGFNTL